jgi:hypothetical protein
MKDSFMRKCFLLASLAKAFSKTKRRIAVRDKA